jgi:hypothetical protein
MGGLSRGVRSRENGLFRGGSGRERAGREHCELSMHETSRRGWVRRPASGGASHWTTAVGWARHAWSGECMVQQRDQAGGRGRGRGAAAAAARGATYVVVLRSLCRGAKLRVPGAAAAMEAASARRRVWSVRGGWHGWALEQRDEMRLGCNHHFRHDEQCAGRRGGAKEKDARSPCFPEMHVPRMIVT